MNAVTRFLTSGVVYAKINRLKASITGGHGVAYPQAASDVQTLLDEFERVRADNDHLRKTHASLWSIANGSDSPWESRMLVALACMLIVLAVVVIALGRQIGT